MKCLILLNVLSVAKSLPINRLNDSKLMSVYQNHDSIHEATFTFNSPMCSCYEKKLALRYLPGGYRCVEISDDYSYTNMYQVCEHETITFDPHTYIDPNSNEPNTIPPPGHARSLNFLPYKTVRCSDFNFENTDISTIKVTSSRTNNVCKRENGIFVKNYEFDNNENYYVQYTVGSVPYINVSLSSFPHFNVTFTKDVKLDKNTYKSYKHLPITYATTCDRLFGTENNTGIKVHIENAFNANTVYRCIDIADAQTNGLTSQECKKYSEHIGRTIDFTTKPNQNHVCVLMQSSSVEFGYFDLWKDTCDQTSDTAAWGECLCKPPKSTCIGFDGGFNPNHNISKYKSYVVEVDDSRKDVLIKDLPIQCTYDESLACYDYDTSCPHCPPLGTYKFQTFETLKNAVRSYSDSQPQNIYGPISSWDVSQITKMSSLFSGDFNEDISSWNVGNVEDMSYMFELNTIFNQNISNWDVKNVYTMRYMFDGAESFNQDISAWDVSKVSDMEHMFDNTDSLSDCNKRKIYDSWHTKLVNTTFQYPSWSTLCPPSMCQPPWVEVVANVEGENRIRCYHSTQIWNGLFKRSSDESISTNGCWGTCLDPSNNNNGKCDDGGEVFVYPPGSPPTYTLEEYPEQNTLCSYGTDCEDCGLRPYTNAFKKLPMYLFMSDLDTNSVIDVNVDSTNTWVNELSNSYTNRCYEFVWHSNTGILKMLQFVLRFESDMVDCNFLSCGTFTSYLAGFSHVPDTGQIDYIFNGVDAINNSENPTLGRQCLDFKADKEGPIDFRLQLKAYLIS